MNNQTQLEHLLQRLFLEVGLERVRLELVEALLGGDSGEIERALRVALIALGWREADSQGTE